MHLREVGVNVILALINGQVLHLPLVGLVADDHLGLHELKYHYEKDQATRDLPTGSITCTDEIALLGMEVVVAYPRDMVLQN